MPNLSSLVSFATALIACAAVGCSPQPVPREGPSSVMAPAYGAPGVPPTMGASPGRSASVGVVECGAARCDAKASTCVRIAGKAPQCVARAARDDFARGGSSEDSVLDCDDDGDCAQGEHCCAGQDWGGTGPHMHMCSKDRCSDAIACVPAAGCPSNLTCAAVGTSGDAHCEPAVAGASCGAVRCGGSTPACCWDTAKGRGSCVAEPGQSSICTGDDEELFRCRGRKDCGGYDCCQYMARNTGCASTCPGAALGVVCETFADCPGEGLGPGGVRQRYDRCENNACTGKLCNPGTGWVPCETMP